MKRKRFDKDFLKNVKDYSGIVPKKVFTSDNAYVRKQICLVLKDNPTDEEWERHKAYIDLFPDLVTEETQKLFINEIKALLKNKPSFKSKKDFVNELAYFMSHPSLLDLDSNDVLSYIKKGKEFKVIYSNNYFLKDIQEELKWAKHIIVLMHVGENWTLEKINALTEKIQTKKNLVYPLVTLTKKIKSDEIGLSILLIK